MKNHKQVTKAVIALAGYGTRFLPATKNQPKQMLPIIDKPIVHYVVEEAVKAGIQDVILVTQAGQHSMEDYFDSHFEMEKVLEDNGKTEYLIMIKGIPEMANFIFVRQHKNLPYGNGTPLLTVQNLIDDDEAFVYMFGDDLTRSEVPVTKQLIDIYEKYDPKAVLAVQEVPDNEVEKYGTVKYKENPSIPNEMEYILEKMPLGQNPSNMAQFGRFVFTYDVIEEANKTPTGKGNELWVADILCNMAKEGKKVIAQPIDGEWLTTGDPLHFLQTTLKFALDRDDLRDDIKAYMKELLK
ncbi:UTP--glucose-1-phosphate uridylyltransferase [candidate division WWE3 bacterium]|uniref:UTP--glucose-1-phosphate uridylyltransferase n=1 Tax=candidate division WWE3 bacterium TaxID=2053526 RepID=A0A7X9DK35_UNCKA|nr:UTP--glucose-1-phosphate uridylyltransferase [candidate division WWE3 bacterium]